MTPGDEEVAQILRKSRKPVLVLANKIDDPSHEPADLSSSTSSASAIPSRSPPFTGTARATCSTRSSPSIERIAPAGRPRSCPDDAIRGRDPRPPERRQVRASSTRCSAATRVIVETEIPGTTRDAVDTVLVRGDRTFLSHRHRRPAPQAPSTGRASTYYSELRSIRGRRDALNVALVLVDSSEGVVEQDIAVADVARHGRLLDARWCLAKWDPDDDQRRGHARPSSAAALRQRPPFDRGLGSTTGRGLERPPRWDRGALRPPRRSGPDARAEPRPRRAARSAAAAEKEARPPARTSSTARRGPRPPAALPLLGQRSGPRDPRLWLLGREPAAREVWPSRACRSRSTS